MKPILFNTEMVRAILDGRKTVTRRLIKFKAGQNPQWTGYVADGAVIYGSHNIPAVKSQYQPGDILYVRETWQYAYDMDGNENIDWESGRYLYAADNPAPFNCWIMPDGTERDTMPWHPSIHMPKEAARIFLRVTNVRAERLQKITADQVAAEGIYDMVPANDAEELCEYCPLPNEKKGVHYQCGTVSMCEGSHCNDALAIWEEEFIGLFAGLWESTIKDKHIGDYGWDANPWVWVIEFEKISKEEATKC